MFIGVYIVEPRRVRPDTKGRVPLGRLAAGVSSFSVTCDGDKIILQPYSEIPTSEKWLFDNKMALRSLKTGLEQAQLGELKSKGSFSKYADDDSE